MKKILKNKKAFTLIEIIIAISISTIVMIGVLYFIGKINTDINVLQNKSTTLLDTIKLQNKINSSRLNYNYPKIIVDNSQGFDTILLVNSGSSKSILIGVVDMLDSSSNYQKLVPNNLQDIYSNNVIGVKELTQTQTNDILSDSGVLKNVIFYEDDVYSGLHPEFLQAINYNSGNLLELNINLFINNVPTFYGKKINEVYDDYKININLDF